MGGKLMKWIGDKEKIILPYVAKTLGVNEENLVHFNIKYSNGLISFNGVLPDNVKVIGAEKLSYVTNKEIFNIPAEEFYNNDFTSLRYFKSPETVYKIPEGFLLDATYYKITEEMFNKIKKEVKEQIKENWNEELKKKVMKHYADYPVDLEVIGDFEKFKLKYHPVDNWIGDEWRGGDTWRSSVDTESIKESIEEFDPFIEPFNEFIKNSFYKYAQKIGELKSIKEILFNSATVEEVTPKIRDFTIEKTKKEMLEQIENIKNKKHFTERDFFNIKKMKETIKKYNIDINIPKDIQEKYEKVINAKSILIYKTFAQNFFLSRKIGYRDDNVILETFDREYKNFLELPEEILNKHKVFEKILKASRINTNVNTLLKADKVNMVLSEVLEKKGAKIVDYKIERKNNKPLEVKLIKFNNFPEVIDRTDISTGIIIGKGGENIKALARKAEMKYINLISEEEYNQKLKEKEKMSLTNQIDYFTNFLDDIRENFSQDEVKEFLDTLSEMTKHKQNFEYDKVAKEAEKLKKFADKLPSNQKSDFALSINAIIDKAEKLQKLYDLDGEISLSGNDENFEEILAKKANEMNIDKEIVDEYLNKNQKPQQEATAEAPAVKIKR